ncbi:MAG: hypothetical protein ACM3PS_14900 [Syntrophothermus sp.]
MKTIRLRGTQVGFPDACLVCLGVPQQKFTMERTFFQGRRSRLLQLSIPLCHRHLNIAARKTLFQAWCERYSPVGEPWLVDLFSLGFSCPGLIPVLLPCCSM